MIGEVLQFSLSFDNTDPTDPGYGPYVDLILPTTGTDGDDGISFVSASYTVGTLVTTELTFDAAGEAEHPYAVDTNNDPIIVNGTPGDQLIVFLLPFGSFAPDQPAATININASMSNLADYNVPLDIQANGGFWLGNDPLNNPAVDPSIIGPTDQDPVNPIVMTMTKTYIGPEDETATGPNYPRTYRIGINIADGQVVGETGNPLQNFVISDLLPEGMQFLSVTSSTPGGTITPPTPPTNELIVTYDSITGCAGCGEDVFVEFSFYVPEDDSTGIPILPPTTGASRVITNTSDAGGLWTPIDTRDPVVTLSESATDSFTAKSVAVQKSLSPTANIVTGDTLEYTLRFQVSDYFGFEDVLVFDTMDDGLRIDSTFTPKLNVTRGGSSTGEIDFDSSNWTYVVDGSGMTITSFDVSDQLAFEGQSDQLLGGYFPSGTSGPTEGYIVYRAVVQEFYIDGDFVTGNDILTNSSSVAGDVLNPDLTPTGNTQSDSTGGSVTIVTGDGGKTLYAVNEIIGAAPVITAGDEVTYRLQYTIPQGNFKMLALEDYLPLPLYYVDDPLADGSSGWTWSEDLSGNLVPAAGQYQFTTSDTLPRPPVTTTTTTDIISNKLEFDLLNFNLTAGTSRQLDILFTITVTDEPFADQLQLTNQVQISVNNTEGQEFEQEYIQQVTVTEPNLAITKGIVSVSPDQSGAVFDPAAVGPATATFNAPGSGPAWTGTITSAGLATTPIDSNLSGVDAQDKATFAIVVENTGTGINGAFDVIIQDDFPSGYALPAILADLNLQVIRGDGTPMPYTDLGGGGAYLSGLFGNGLQLDDPDPDTGSLAPGDPDTPTNDGLNLAVVTFDLELAGTTNPSAAITNTASLTNYAAQESGVNFATTPLTDEAEVTTLEPDMDKTRTSINDNVVIGELVTYEVVVTVPEGQSESVTLVDTLDQGLAIVSIDSLTPSAGGFLSTSIGTFADVLSATLISNVGSGDQNMGRRYSMNFGTLINSNDDNTTPETLTITYTAVAINNTGNTAGQQLNNQAVWAYTGGSTSDTSENVTIVEPTLEVDKVVVPTTADASDLLNYTITITNTGSVDGFDIDLSDTIPSTATYVTGSLQNPSGIAPNTLAESGNVITATWGTFAASDTSVITFQATVDPLINPGVIVTNTADIQWTSLSGSPGPLSPYNPLSYERTGDTADPGDAANDYRDSDDADVTIFEPSIDKNRTSTNDDVVIGELVTYEVVVTIPEGQSENVNLVDTLDTGLAIVSVDSLTPSAGGFLTTSVVGGFPAVLAATTISDVGVGAENQGRRYSMDFQTLTNSDNDPGTQETLTITYTAVVINNMGNTSGQTLNNESVWSYTGGSISDTSENVTVVEPALDIDKTVSPTSGDAGDLLTYSITVTNTGSVDAFDVNLSDTLPVGLTYVTGTLLHTSGITPGTLTEVGGVITATWGTFAGSGTSVITFQATVDLAVAPDTIITNTTETQWTSLAGTPTQISPYNPLSFERTGDPADPGDAANDYRDSDSADFGVNTLEAAKILVSTDLPETPDGDLAIGETVVFQITATIPHGTTTNLVITDQLPNDTLPSNPGILDATSAYVYSIGSNLEPLTVQSITLTDTTGDGYDDLVTYTFGTVVNAGSGTIGENDMIRVRIEAQAVDDPANYDGLTLTNTGTVDSDSTNPVSDTAEVDIIEPLLDIQKSATPANVDAGDVVNYSLTIDHEAGSTSDAFDVVVQDTLSNAGVELVVGSVTTSLGTVISGNTPGDTEIQVAIATLPLTTTVTINYQGQITIAADPGDTVPNTAEMRWDSFPGTGGREGTDSISQSVTLFDSSIEGTVFWDIENDSIFVSGTDPILSGVIVTLTGFDNLGNPVNLTDTTDINGNFQFENLRPGTYTLTETQPTSYLEGTNTAGTAGGTANVVPDQISDINLQPGQSFDATDYWFAELQPSSLSGFVFDDLNNNGIFEAGESGINGVTLTLTGVDDHGTITPQTVVTAGGGAYHFLNLRPNTDGQPGIYAIEETQPTGYLSGIDSVGVPMGGTADSLNDRLYDIPILQQQAGTFYNFGELQPSRLEGRVFRDYDDTGRYDPSAGDYGIGGVLITLRGIDDRGNSVLATMQTLNNGTYEFNTLRPGTYEIEETQPIFYYNGLDSAGVLGGIDNIVDDLIYNIPITPGADGVDYWFGEGRIRDEFVSKRLFLSSELLDDILG